MSEPFVKPDKQPFLMMVEHDHPYRTISVTPTSPNIGAEIGDVDVTKPLSAEQVEELRDAFTRYQVLFFRDQPVSNNDQSRLAAYFGPLGEHTGKYANSKVTDNPHVRRFHYDETSKRISGENFHSDLASWVHPPPASMLYLHTVPPYGGGDTIFASMYAAYEALSPQAKAYLEPLTATHDGRPIFGPDAPVSVHPLIARHPVSGRKGIYANVDYTTHVNDVPRLESARILQFLFDHCCNDIWTYRFRWRPHSIAFWDNRCVQHKALWDYWPHVRSGYRVQLEGTPENAIPGWSVAPAQQAVAVVE
jgi:taurine dioxygenase